jgi:hypothetical protein
MPFFLIRLPPLLQNIGDAAQSPYYTGFFDEFPNKDAYDLFELNNNSDLLISGHQKEFVHDLLGYSHDNIDAQTVRQKIRQILFSSLWR